MALLCLEGWVGYTWDGETGQSTLPFGVFGLAVVDEFICKWHILDFIMIQIESEFSDFRHAFFQISFEFFSRKF